MNRLGRLTKGGVVLVATCSVVWFFMIRADSEYHQPHEKNEDTRLVSSEDPVKGRLICRSVFLEDYGSEDSSILSDLEAVSLLLNDCQLLFKNFDSFFLPGNREITSFLSGGNPEKITWIPKSHFAINTTGKLVDRFGMPLFFHRINGLKFEIYSAGKDGKMWTKDDVVFPPPPVSAEKK